MRIATPCLIVLATLLFGFVTACSADKQGESPAQLADNTPGDTVFNRGVAVGRVIEQLPVGSREREKALIEAHGMATAMSDAGYPQSAARFEAGVRSAL